MGCRRHCKRIVTYRRDVLHVEQGPGPWLGLKRHCIKIVTCRRDVLYIEQYFYVPVLCWNIIWWFSNDYVNIYSTKKSINCHQECNIIRLLNNLSTQSISASAGNHQEQPVLRENLYVYKFLKILSRVRRFACDLQHGFWIGFIDTLFTQLGTTDNAALSLIYTLDSSPLLTH
jgi:hypothetical protein